jgi:sortase A
VMRDGVFVVKPSQTEVLDPTPDAATLTLTSCNPKYSARERLIVKAQLAPDEPPPLPPPANVRLPKNLDAGLSGTRGSRAPVVVWGAVVTLVGGLWFLVFHRYHRWTTWFAGAIPFAVALAVLYFYLERVLPSNY